MAKKRADGRYLKQIRIGYTAEGKPKYKNIFARTRNELDLKVAEFNALKNKGVIVEESKMTFGEWADIWLKTYKTDVREGTRLMYQYVINKHLAPLKHCKLKNIKHEQIQEIINSLSGHRRTQGKTLLTVKQILKRAVINDYTIKNVADGVILPHAQKPVKRALTDAEITDILSLQLPAQTKIFIELMLYCGLRRGEAWALNYTDIKDGNVNVNKTVRLSGGLHVGEPKTAAGNRIVPIPSIIADDIKNHCRIKNGLFVFGDGHLMTEREFRQMWRGLIKTYNESKGGHGKVFAISGDITPHIFRHTYATMLYRAGIDLKTAQYLLGHSTIQMTLDIYTHIGEESTKTAAEKLDKYLTQDAPCDTIKQL